MADFQSIWALDETEFRQRVAAASHSELKRLAEAGCLDGKGSKHTLSQRLLAKKCASGNGATVLQSELAEPQMSRPTPGSLEAIATKLAGSQSAGSQAQRQVDCVDDVPIQIKHH